ncbi:MAG: cytosine deaminase-like metal-dependent hydrolase [Betaproteobacteria bacterium]|nr:cytosine deaminase-like metal-dependent hydrolase [Betaproteobacteria bacterium]
MQDLLLHNGTVVTMDRERRILDETSVAIRDGRIIEVGRAADLSAKYRSAKMIDCKRKAILPGMVDLHGYLGGSLLKSIGQNLDGGSRRKMLEDLLTAATDEEWWEVETQLSALERLKMGTTCMFSMMGGNGTRTDDVVFTHIAARELERIGLRARIGLGPARPPWPRRFAYWRDGVKTERRVGFEEVMDNCERLLSERKTSVAGIVDYGVALSRIGNRNEHDPVWSPEREQWVHKQAEAIAHLKQKYGVTFWTHMYGNAVEYAHDEKLGLLGPDTILSHCTGISERAIGIMRETGTHAAHHPRAARIYTYPGRCPVPELIDAGVNVALGADTPSTHNCDIFLDMKAAIDQQRIHFKDARMLPPGKVLEMATIDGCKALGLDSELGSIETGKQADLITVDLFQPHLYPVDMLVYRLVYNATGADVSDVVVGGRLVMEARKILTIDEGQVLERVQSIYDRFVVRAELEPFRKNAARMWGASRE